MQGLFQLHTTPLIHGTCTLVVAPFHAPRVTPINEKKSLSQSTSAPNGVSAILYVRLVAETMCGRIQLNVVYYRAKPGDGGG